MCCKLSSIRFPNCRDPLLNTFLKSAIKSGDKLRQDLHIFGSFTFGLSITEIPFCILSTMFMSGFIVPPKGCNLVKDLKANTQNAYVSVPSSKFEPFSCGSLNVSIATVQGIPAILQESTSMKNTFFVDISNKIF